VQAIAQLSDGAGVAITVADYRTPSDSPILTGRGLKPDLFKPSMADDAAAVTQVLANNPRRLKWIRSRLASCRPPPQI
jgi:C-terminal processing protease CtpA/Prc